jgi:hypothetical protein
MSEGARMDRLLAAVRQHEIALALQRARTLGGNVPCCGSKVESPLSQKTPLESVLLEKQLKCYTYMGTAVGLESMRLNAQNQCNIDASTDPVNPDARFSQYRGPYIPPVCPAIPQEILNGNLPKASTECPLPNKPFYRSRA